MSSRGNDAVGERARPRRDRLIREREHDPYRRRERPPEPLACEDCGAVFRNGRWQWIDASSAPRGGPCPACRRIRDDNPAGLVTLTGEFQAAHQEEIRALISHVEAREKAAHALNRIMEATTVDDGLRISTTDMHLARAIGEALRRAYKGEIELRYAKEGSLLRVRWSR